MIQRKEYLDALVRMRDMRAVKVIRGIRGSGKSSLLELYADYLHADGVSGARIVFVDLEDAAYNELETGEQLYDFLDGRLPRGGRSYLFLDEIRRIEDFEPVLRKLAARGGCDLYLASSVSGAYPFPLSPAFPDAAGQAAASRASGAAPSFPSAPPLDGRYAEIKMLPLSFREYVSAFPEGAAGSSPDFSEGENSGLESLYADYAANGAFPHSLEFSNPKDRTRYLRGIFDSVVLRDIVLRGRFPDIAALEETARFMFDNIGYICSAKSVADIMTHSGKKISVHTVESYLAALTDSFVLHKVSRYDIKAKKHLKTGAKYYAADTGLRRALLGERKDDDERVLENLVYLELLRRGWEIHIGKVGNREVDFAVSRGGEREYYQVALSVSGAKAASLGEELAPLEAVGDHNPKYLLTMDRVPASYNGIKRINVLNWLLR